MPIPFLIRYLLLTIENNLENRAVGVMKPGHCFTIEPMINEGLWRDNLWPDDWTAVTEVRVQCAVVRSCTE